MPRFLPGLILPLLVFGVVLVTHVCSPVITSFDSMWSIHTALSIVREGDTDLGEHWEAIARRWSIDAPLDLALSGDPDSEARQALIDRLWVIGIEVCGGHIHSVFPLGAPVLAAPLVWGADVLARLRGIDLRERISEPHWYEAPIMMTPAGPTERFVASVFVALAAVFIWLSARLSLGVAGSLLVVFVFAFCSPVWSTASRGLWSHTPSVMLLSAALWILLRAGQAVRWVPWAAVPLSLAFFARPSNALSIALLTVWVAVKHPRQLWKYVLLGLAVALPWVVFNLNVYGTPLQSYFRGGRLGTNPDFGTALVANLVSPGRGLFVFSPVFLLVFAGVALRLRRGTFNLLDACLLAILGLHWLAVSSFDPWWGGHCFGPRFFTDMTPYLVYFLIPVITVLRESRGAGWVALGVVFTAATVFSFHVHLRGATVPNVHGWNSNPDLAEDPSKVWDWSDAQFARLSDGEIAEGSERFQGARVNWSRALRFARRAVRADPNNPVAHALRGRAAAEQGLSDEAREAWIQAICAPADSESPDYLAAVHQHLRALGLSPADALRVGGAHPWQCHLVARWLRRQDHPEEALAAWDVAMESDANVEYHFGRHRALMALGQAAEALAAAEQALEMNPEHTWAVLYIGDALDALGRRDEARARWQSCLEMKDLGTHRLARERLGLDDSP